MNTITQERLKELLHLVNLREATDKVNKRNQPKYYTNKSGITGVHWDKSKKNWLVHIGTGYTNKYLGRYTDFIEAVYTRWIAEDLYNYTPIHGK